MPTATVGVDVHSAMASMPPPTELLVASSSSVNSPLGDISTRPALHAIQSSGAALPPGYTATAPVTLPRAMAGDANVAVTLHAGPSHATMSTALVAPPWTTATSSVRAVYRKGDDKVGRRRHRHRRRRRQTVTEEEHVRGLHSQENAIDRE